MAAKDCDQRAPYPEAVLEALADHVEGDGVDAGVDRCHVNANIIQDQEEAEGATVEDMIIFHSSLLNDVVDFFSVVRCGNCITSLPEQLTPVWVFLIIDSELQDTAEVER